MSRQRPPAMPPHLEERFWRDKPPGTRVTPSHELGLGNLPHEDDCDCPCAGKYPNKPSYPRWDLMLDYWRGGDDEC